jgi:hypothetical protein
MRLPCGICPLRSWGIYDKVILLHGLRMGFFCDMTTRRAIAFFVLAAVLVTTGMARHCLCRCCGQDDAESQHARPVAESNGCCNAGTEKVSQGNGADAAPIRHGQRVVPATQISTCSCEMGPPVILAAVAANSSTSVLKSAPILTSRDCNTGSPALLDYRDAVSLPGVRSIPYTSVIISNCSFLC